MNFPSFLNLPLTLRKFLFAKSPELSLRDVLFVRRSKPTFVRIASVPTRVHVQTTHTTAPSSLLFALVGRKPAAQPLAEPHISLRLEHEILTPTVVRERFAANQAFETFLISKFRKVSLVIIIVVEVFSCELFQRLEELSVSVL